MSKEKLKEYLQSISKDRLIELCLQYKFDAEITEQQLKETKDEIDLYKKFVSGGTIEEVIEAVWRKREIDQLKQQLAEKTAKLEFANKEIERLKASNCYIHDLHNNLYREYQKKNDELYKNQTQLAIQELEKVKEWLEPKYFDYEQINYLTRIINNQIKELKGE